MIFGFIGFAGSGKDTAANILVKDYNFKKISFANPLKDMVARLFSWDRMLLEGNTPESRAWRELPDEYWSEKFGYAITPRYMLQYMGTDVMRKNLKDDIWILSLERTLESQKDQHFVISDVRFHNEVEAIRKLGGKIIRIKRGPEPIWFEIAKNNPEKMSKLYPDVHESEYSWVSVKNLETIDNSGTLSELKTNIRCELETI